MIVFRIRPGVGVGADPESESEQRYHDSATLIATSLSPKYYSANVPLYFCTNAYFDIKYFFSTKTLLAFWIIPN